MTSTWPTSPPAQATPAASPLARSVGTDRRGRARTLPIFGMVVHTTGSGPAEYQKQTGTPAVNDALDYYLGRGRWKGKSDGFPHYLIGYDGTIYLICPESHVAWHAGWAKGRARWDGWTAPAWWTSVWSPRGARTPADLLPPRAGSPNDAHIGVELLGSESGRGFTDAQYDSLARLVIDVFRRNGLTAAVPPNRQLLGHEDVEPILRANRGGGWDPGAHRTSPTFSWPALWSRIQAGGGPVAPPAQAPPPPAAPSPSPSPGTGIASAPWAVFSSVAGVAEAAAAFAGGERGANRLTDIIFNARHRERAGRPIASGETALAQEWRWIRDNVVASVLRIVPAAPAAPPSAAPAVPPAATPAAAQFGRAIPAPRRWAGILQLLDRYRGDVPLDFLLGWIEVESDGRIDEVTSLDERGFFQIHPDESKDARPPIQHARLSTDPDYSVQAGLQLARYYAALARSRFPWIPAGSELFWRVVKLQHAMGSPLAKRFLTDMHNRGIPFTWDNIKRFELSDGPRFHRLFRTDRGRFGRNVDRVFAYGRARAHSLGR